MLTGKSPRTCCCSTTTRNLQDYYKQHFLGLVHVFPISEGQSFKTDLRYFDSSSDGRNGDAGYQFNNNGGYAKTPGEVDNKTWSAMFTYTLGGSAFLLDISESAMTAVLSSSTKATLSMATVVTKVLAAPSFYLFTDTCHQLYPCR